MLFMIAKENLSYMFIESEGFKNLLKEIFPKFKIPSRKTIKSRMMEKYEVLFTNL